MLAKLLLLHRPNDTIPSGNQECRDLQTAGRSPPTVYIPVDVLDKTGANEPRIDSSHARMCGGDRGLNADPFHKNALDGGNGRHVQQDQSIDGRAFSRGHHAQRSADRPASDHQRIGSKRFNPAQQVAVKLLEAIDITSSAIAVAAVIGGNNSPAQLNVTGQVLDNRTPHPSRFCARGQE